MFIFSSLRKTSSIPALSAKSAERNFAFAGRAGLAGKKGDSSNPIGHRIAVQLTTSTELSKAKPSLELSTVFLEWAQYLACAAAHSIAIHIVETILLRHLAWYRFVPCFQLWPMPTTSLNSSIFIIISCVGHFRRCFASSRRGDENSCLEMLTLLITD